MPAVRRRLHRRQLLSRHCDSPRRQRPGRRRARVRTDAAGDGADHDLPRGPLRPLLGRRPEGRNGPRLHRPGDRRRDRAGALRVAQPRPRAARREPLLGWTRPTTTSTSTPSTSTTTATCSSRAGTPGRSTRSTGTPARSSGASAASAATSQLGPGVTFAWQHNPLPAGENTIRAVRQRERRKQPGSAAFARDLDPPRHDRQDRDAGQGDHTSRRDLSVPSQGNAQALDNGDTFVGWGQLGARLRVRPARQAPLRRHAHRRVPTPTAPTGPTGPANPTRSQPQPRGRTLTEPPPSTRSGTARPTSPPGASSQARPRLPLAPVRTGPWNGLDTSLRIAGVPREVEGRSPRRKGQRHRRVPACSRGLIAHAGRWTAPAGLTGACGSLRTRARQSSGHWRS